MSNRSQYAKRYYKLNKFIILEKQMEYYHNNKEKISQRMRERYRKVCDDPLLRQKRLDYLKEWRAKNHTKSAINSKRYYERHKEKIKERARESYHVRMENLNIQRRDRYNKKVTEKNNVTSYLITVIKYLSLSSLSHSATSLISFIFIQDYSVS